jgi:hypothetical protein
MLILSGWIVQKRKEGERYDKAREAYHDEIRKGNYNFKGIGRSNQDK